MALEKSTVIDKIEIVGEHKYVQVRQATVITDDGTEVSRNFHRYTLAPGSDLTEQPAEVVAIANAAWTQEVLTAYSASLTPGLG